MKCQKCKFYVYTRTLGSMHKEVWHCRYGYNPNQKMCFQESLYNEAYEAGNEPLAEFYKIWWLTGKMPNTQLELFNQ